ncbi:MAG: hypothetical protein PHU88_05550 [candidate division Zixibacteria bacterium]|nr:hypothetical protein [candidate division Zixibacteria bacterium]MDD5426111.1 hypothetical protein [candidate division Zixibacteria bacterium]
MHFSKRDIELYVEKKILDTDKINKLEKHLKECEFCREYLENYQLYCDTLESVSDMVLSPEGEASAKKLYYGADKNKVIELYLLSETTPLDTYLAADGKAEIQPDIINLATFYSEDPELVLLVMRNKNNNQDYLQLVSDNPEMVAHALVQVPELEIEQITDFSGRANLDKPFTSDITQYKWQIKLPEAVFELAPLEYDPDKTEYQKEIILETDHNDRIQITFEGKTAGKQLSLRILELDGHSDFPEVKVVVNQEELVETKTAGPMTPVTFNLHKTDKAIKIRLYC